MVALANKPASTSTGAAGREATSHLPDPRGRIICIYDDDERIGDLITTVARLGYVALDGRGWPPAAGCLAALVGGGFDPGFDLCTELSAACPVILIAGEDDFAFRLAAARAGVEVVVAPPLDMVELGAWLGEFDDAGDQAFTILVVDDDELAAESCALALEAAGMGAHVVTDPAQVLDRVASVSPDLVLLDMHMPGANGLEVARIIRQSRSNLSLPVMFLSAERDIDRQDKARRIGGDDFISKPVDLDRLASLVRMRAARAVALRQVMERDSLTGLLNHASFKDRLRAEVEHSQRTRSPISVCLIDLDRFKQVNDIHGHQAGDHVIQTLAHTLLGRLRRIDVVARYGGEEFAILMLDTDDALAAKAIDEIRRMFGQIAFKAANEEFFVTLSAGIASSRSRMSVEKLIAAADEALYGAKSQGRDRVVIA